MSLNAQRTKLKSLPRMRGGRVSVNTNQGSKLAYNSVKEDDSDIYSNFELTYVLSRHVIGNIGEVTTTENDRVCGVIQAISPSGDMGLSYPYKACAGKNGHINGASHIVPLSNWKIIRIPNVKISDCLLDEIKAESDTNIECESSVANEEKELVPFFASSDAPKDCFLDEGGFTVEEMFKTNKELFSVSTTYNPDLPEYKTPVDKSAPNYHETEARCAQLARELEASDFYTENLDDVCEDEGVSIDKAVSSHESAVPKFANRESHIHPNRNINSDITQLTKQVAQVSVHAGEHGSEKSVSHSKAHPTTGFVAEAPSLSAPLQENTPELNSTALPPSSALVSSPSTEHSDPGTSTKPMVSSDVKIKKSTLDPNALPFLPLSMQTPVPSSTQGAMHNLAFTHVIHPNTSVNASAPNAVANLAAFVPGPQSQIYVPSCMPYAPQSGNMSHVIPAAIAASAANSAAQHMRGGSLPPSLHQQPFPMGVNSSPGVLLQPNQQNVSVAQMIPASGNTTRFSNPSLTRQCSNELATTNSQTIYGQMPNMAVSAMQPPFYQIPQTGASIPLWVTGTPQMGFNFVPGAGNSSALMVSNLQLPQGAGQQIYPAHAMVHVQPQLAIPTMSLESGPASAPQGQHHPMFQAQPGQFSEHALSLPQYAQGMMFAHQPGGFYPAAPLIGGPGVLNPAVRAGLLPVLNQQTVQHPGGAHQPVTLDSLHMNQSLPASSFPQSNCQPHFTNYNAPHPLLQAAHLGTNTSVNPQNIQPEAYQNMVALLARNFAQGH